MKPLISTIIYCFVYAMLNVAGAAIIKLKLKVHVLNSIKDWIKLLVDVQVLIAFLLIFTSALVMFKALSSAAFSFTIPVATGLNFAITVLIGYFLFKDQLNSLSLIGFGLIVSGIAILSLSSFNNLH